MRWRAGWSKAMVLAAWVVVWGGAFAQEVQVISSTPQAGTVPGTETAQPVKIPGQVIRVEPNEGQVQLPGDGEATAHLTTRTRRVAVDVVVTGEKGKPVAGLTANDFTVFEDGVPQPVKSFDPHTPATPVAYTPPPIPKLPPNTFLNLETAPAAGTPTVLLYDVLNTPRDAQGYAHEQMVSFIKHRKPGTQIAIFTLGDKLRLLQGFTEDSEALANALDRSNGHVAQSTQLERAGTTGTASTSLAPDPSTLQDPRAFNNPNVTQTVNALTSAEALEQSYMLDQRIDLTLDGLSEIGRFLAGLPGRKNLVWLSASFPSGVLPDGNIAVNSLTQDQSTRNYGERMRQTTDLLNLSHVAVYPVDVRGLVVPGAYSAATAKGQGPGSTGSSQQVATYVQDQALDHSTMDSIADSTGGKAFYSTNDLKGAVDRAMENGSTYYSLTYAPTNTRLDGSARKIKVKLDKPGYTLAYRTTYFADDLQRVAEEMADGPQSPLSPSLEHGAPVAHELFLEARLQVIGEPQPPTAKQIEMLAAYESVTAKKKHKKTTQPVAGTMMQNYLITYGLLPRQLEMQPGPGGVHKASIELGVLSYDQDGHKLAGVDSKIEDSIPAQRYALLSDEGYHLYQTVTIPVAASSVRLAVRDTVANRIGSIEVPLPLAKSQATVSAR